MFIANEPEKEKSPSGAAVSAILILAESVRCEGRSAAVCAEHQPQDCPNFEPFCYSGVVSVSRTSCGWSSTQPRSAKIPIIRAIMRTAVAC